MKNLLKIAVITACALPVAANAALTYTPPQAMVLTCNGTAPSVTNKTSALATFACADGKAPQAVGITSGMGDLLGLASGAAVLAASEAVPSLALPGVGSGSGSGNAGSGNGAANGAGSGSGIGSSNGSGVGTGNAAVGNSGSGSAGNGSGNESNSRSGRGSSAGNGSGNGSGSGSAGSGGGGFLGNLLNSVGHAVQQIGHAVLTGGSARIQILGGSAASGSAGALSGGSNTTQAGQSGSGSQKPKPSVPVTILHSQPKLFEFTGGPDAYRNLIRWIAGYEQTLDIGGGYLNEVVHPGVVTAEQLPDGPGRYFAFSRMSGTVDFYIAKLGHKSIAYPGNPIPFVSTINVDFGYTQPAIWEASQKVQIQATNTYASGPQFYTSEPGNRNGPFWPSPFTLGGPEPDVAGVCHDLQQITHVSMGGQCWSSKP